jgi:hypothetical protein
LLHGVGLIATLGAGFTDGAAAIVAALAAPESFVIAMTRAPSRAAPLNEICVL